MLWELRFSDVASGQEFMGGCQTYGPFLGPWYNTAPVLRDQNFDNRSYGAFCKSGVPCVAILLMTAIYYLGLYIGAADFWKMPYGGCQELRAQVMDVMSPDTDANSESSERGAFKRRGKYSPLRRVWLQLVHDPSN